MNAVVETRGLCKQYGPALRVNHLDLTVPEGAVYGFLGPQRGGQIHHPQAASGAGQAHGRGNRRLWAALGSQAPAWRLSGRWAA